MDLQKIKDSLLLPKTTLPLKNNNHLETEKQIRAQWEKEQVYREVLSINKNNSSFIFHSGPAYSNGKIHLGHVLNFSLKDIIVRFYSGQGYYAPFLLGWDTHGLPIEHQVLKTYSGQDIDLRLTCDSYAQEQINLQKEQLKKLGLFTDYNDYYATKDKHYEAEQIRIFAELVKRKLIYRGLRPIHWSWSHVTALAENEIEYLPKEDYSCYFSLELVDGEQLLGFKNIHLLIWTTQPWTIPANQLVAIKKRADYSLIKWNNKNFLLLTERINKLKWLKEAIIIKKNISGEQLLGLKYYHPYQEKIGKIVDGSKVISEQEGTGILHCAPAFGAEDFALATKEKLTIICPLDEKGFFNKDINVAELIGKHYSEANDWVIKDLSKKEILAHQTKFIHSYPHDWRDKTPLVYRLTEQWFIDIQVIKKNLLENVKKVKWHPVWGQEKMKQVITDRNDWCISRQRKWGVPLPLLFNENKPLLVPEIIYFIADIFEKKGSNCWFNGEILPELKNKFPQWINANTKTATDTMDVWFDSGASYNILYKKVMKE